MERIITDEILNAYKTHLIEDEKSQATISKYMHDVRYFADYADGRALDKSLTLDYRTALKAGFAVTSANSMLAAMNSFLRFMGWEELRVRQFTVRRDAYCSEEKELTKEEYRRMIARAEKKGDWRMSMILRTLCGTGIRISELRYITVEAVKNGEAQIDCKGSIRKVFITSGLRKKLRRYARIRGIESGMIFITRTGKKMDRSNIWRSMKKLAEEAEVNAQKVYPHNLRHLFARTFYRAEQDIVLLADILGHSNIETTRIYTVSTGAEHRRKLEKLDLA